MIDFIINNIATITISVILSAAVIAVILNGINKRKQGCRRCAGCPYRGQCGKMQKNEQKDPGTTDL